MTRQLCMLWIVLPTRNEAAIIEANLDRLLAFCRDAFANEDWHIIVADNASTDATRAIVQRIAGHDPRVELMTIEQPGKGGAVLGAWRYCSDPLPPRVPGGREGVGRERWSVLRRHHTTSPPPTPPPPMAGRGRDEKRQTIFCFCDADLATDLHHLPELIAAVRGGADIAAASRYLPGARVKRSVFRTLVSRANRLLLRARFMLRMTDPPCGMKAVSERVVRDIVPLVRDTQWFFDTELCIRAQRAGLRIIELPVAWREPRTGRGGIRKVWRIARANAAPILFGVPIHTTTPRRV